MPLALEKRSINSPNVLVLLGFIALTLLIGFLGGQITAPNIAAWYQGLAKPSFNPPNSVFMPVWTALYIMMAVAAWRIWRKQGWGDLSQALWLIQLLLNLIWSILFFGFHAPIGAFFELLVLWTVILCTMTAFWQTDLLAGLLMLPYLLWVSFAGILNFWIWQLNF